MTASKQQQATETKASESQATEAKASGAKRPPFSVAKGKAVITKKGVVSDGAEIRAEWVSGGGDALAALVKSGHVVKG